jgi:HTH-type transcriptional regulator/antitoxin HigA
VHHIANAEDYDNATRIADALLEEGAMDASHPQHSLFMTICDLIYAYDQIR